MIYYTPAGRTSAGATPAGATPAGATPAGATPAGATPAGATPAGATPAGTTSADLHFNIASLCNPENLCSAILLYIFFPILWPAGMPI